jgi:hypothetical protein
MEPKRVRDGIYDFVDEKNKRINKFANIKSNAIENEMQKRKKHEDKIELMTQFMMDPSSSATKLLEKRREMYELQDALQRDKEKFKEKEEHFKKTEEELRNRDENFHKNIVDYYKNFYEKNQSESHNYNLKLEHEKKINLELQQSIKNLKTKNDKLKKDLVSLRDIHDSLKQYEDYLKKVKDTHENFTEISVIIKKYDDLKAIYENIKDEENKARLKKEDEKKNFREMKSNFEGKINNLIAEIQVTQQELKVGIYIYYYK